MENEISERYQKALVTVAMGFRTEDDIKKNGLFRFTKQEKESLITYVSTLFKNSKSVLALKVKKKGYRSEHINIESEKKLNQFIQGINNIFNEENEIWIVSSSVIECWRCRIYLSSDNLSDKIEMAYSYDDHILDHINFSSDTPYISFKKENINYKVSTTNLSSQKFQESSLILKDILSKYSTYFQKIKDDLTLIGVNGISLDVRINNGYDFHDFDVDYRDVKKVIEFYLSQL